MSEWNKLDQAIWIATEAHEGQKDKAGVDYIKHPLAVMEAMETEDEKIVAVLHDVVEDTPVSLDEIREIFGNVIADAVDSVTRRATETYAKYIQRVKNNPIGKKVKIADVKHNMSPERFDALPESEKGMIVRYKKTLKELEG